MPLTEVDCPEVTAVSWILKSSLLTLCRHSNGRQIALQTFCCPTFSLCSLLGVTDAGLHTLVLFSSAIDLSPSVTPGFLGGGVLFFLQLIAQLSLSPPPPAMFRLWNFFFNKNWYFSTQDDPLLLHVEKNTSFSCCFVHAIHVCFMVVVEKITYGYGGFV